MQNQRPRMQYQQPQPGQAPQAGPPPPRGPAPPPGPPPPPERPPQPEPAHRRRFWEAAWWAGALIWAGLVLLADNAGALPEVEGANIWSWILTGAGLYALALNVWRTVSPREPNPDGGNLLWTGILLVLGLAGFFSFDLALPVILIALGGVLLIRAFAAQRQAPRT